MCLTSLRPFPCPHILGFLESLCLIVPISLKQLNLSCICLSKYYTSSCWQVVVKMSNIYPRDAEGPTTGIDDMTKMSYLNEPGLLHNLAIRYAINEIYVRLFMGISDSLGERKQIHYTSARDPNNNSLTLYRLILETFLLPSTHSKVFQICMMLMLWSSTREHHLGSWSLMFLQLLMSHIGELLFCFCPNFCFLMRWLDYHKLVAGLW